MHIGLQENRYPPAGSSRAVARDTEDAERRACVRAAFDLASSGFDPVSLEVLPGRRRWPRRLRRGGTESSRARHFATGTGWAALAAALHVGPRGTVVGIDLSPSVIAKAREEARRRGLSNVRFRLGDAQHLPYDTAIFDVVLASQEGRLESKDRPRFRRDHAGEVGSLSAAGGIRLPMPTIFARGRKPETAGR